MKTMAVAALAAHLAVAHVAVAQTGSPEPADDQAVRADGEAQALLASMNANAHAAREVLEAARARRRPDEVRCSDEALSRADVALRHGREDAAQLFEALNAHDARAVLTALSHLRARAAASRGAASSATRCIPQENARRPDRTQVIIHVDPADPAQPPTDRASASLR
jgi:hypothetical protein